MTSCDQGRPALLRATGEAEAWVLFQVKLKCQGGFKQIPDLSPHGPFIVVAMGWGLKGGPGDARAKIPPGRLKWSGWYELTYFLAGGE